MAITKVTFKDEDEIDGMSIGPVCLIDEELMAKDPKVGAGGMWPFGYTPQGFEKLDPWRTKYEALQIARDHGVELTEW
jgi:hypothetical protein